jgi:hypothetical protein
VVLLLATPLQDNVWQHHHLMELLAMMVSYVLKMMCVPVVLVQVHISLVPLLIHVLIILVPVILPMDFAYSLTELCVMMEILVLGLIPV